jgi:hypothetical protein
MFQPILVRGRHYKFCFSTKACNWHYNNGMMFPLMLLPARCHWTDQLIHWLLLHTCTHHVRLNLLRILVTQKMPRTGPFSVCVCKLHEPGKAGDESQAQVAAMLSCIFSTKTSPSKHVFLLSQKTSCGWLIMFCLKFVTRKGERQRERERAREIRKTNAPSQRTSNSKTTLMLWRKALTNRGARHA